MADYEADSNIMLGNPKEPCACVEIMILEPIYLTTDKEILENFYNIFYPFTINYNLEKAYEPMFNLEKGKRYLSIIKTYLEK